MCRVEPAGPTFPRGAPATGPAATAPSLTPATLASKPGPARGSECFRDPERPVGCACLGLGLGRSAAGALSAYPAWHLREAQTHWEPPARSTRAPSAPPVRPNAAPLLAKPPDKHRTFLTSLKLFPQEF
uniref:Uncharacterized protein n=1 Tax=Rangifer tarandus platyrhynchus TaxID=3082113 RepID=A0ACB0DZ97_RANTA|nr:unnamed protein product [Rangifer tarandus platyrhynchus]